MSKIQAPEDKVEPSSQENATPLPVQAIECPVQRAMELVGDKYSLQIIHVLIQFERQRFVELEDQINGISPRTLSARLKHLEQMGLILRHQFPTIPPKVEYELTDAGKELATVLSPLKHWPTIFIHLLLSSSPRKTY